MMRRQIAALALALLLMSGGTAEAAPWCGGNWTITFYAAQDYPGVTADGTTTTWGAINRGEQIVASTSLPFGTLVEVEGLGVARVADTGHLGWCHLDWLVATHWEAVQGGRQQRAVSVVGG